MLEGLQFGDLFIHYNFKRREGRTGGRDQHYPLPPWEGNVHLYFSHWKDIYYAHLISYNGQLRVMLLLLLSPNLLKTHVLMVVQSLSFAMCYVH